MTVLETHDTAGRSAPASRVLWCDELTETIKLAVPMAATDGNHGLCRAAAVAPPMP